MTFHPNMDSRVDGVTVLDDLKCRAWPGVVADVWNVTCVPGARGHYVSRAPRLFVLLDSEHDQAMLLSSTPCGAGGTMVGRSNPLCFIPADMPLWSRIDRGGRLRHLDMHLDMAALGERFAGRLDAAALKTLNLSLTDRRVLALARLIAEECAAPAGLDDVYGESLVLALLTIVAGIRPGSERGKGKLAPRQLRKVMNHLEDHFARNVPLNELAALTGLSPSHFAEAFRNSTGLPPHRWQMSKRVEKAKALLGEKGLTPAETATAAGFSDQAHFTRVFKRFEGITPAAWLRRQT